MLPISNHAGFPVYDKLASANTLMFLIPSAARFAASSSPSHPLLPRPDHQLSFHCAPPHGVLLLARGVGYATRDVAVGFIHGDEPVPVRVGPAPQPLQEVKVNTPWPRASSSSLTSFATLALRITRPRPEAIRSMKAFERFARRPARPTVRPPFASNENRESLLFILDRIGGRNQRLAPCFVLAFFLDPVDKDQVHLHRRGPGAAAPHIP